jgi:hypothetical protein
MRTFCVTREMSGVTGGPIIFTTRGGGVLLFGTHIQATAATLAVVGPRLLPFCHFSFGFVVNLETFYCHGLFLPFILSSLCYYFFNIIWLQTMSEIYGEMGWSSCACFGILSSLTSASVHGLTEFNVVCHLAASARHPSLLSTI